MQMASLLARVCVIMHAMGYPLSEAMTPKKLLRAATPSILMMISISIYSVVDGFFVSNFAGKTPFAALNLIYPVIMLLGSLGFMMGAGGSALVAERFGEKRQEEANAFFGNCVIFTIALGAVVSGIAYIFLPNIARLLGADEAMMPDCVSYGRILILGLTAFNLQNLFQNFLVTAEKPNFGFLVTILAGVTNIILDAILIAIFKMGVKGAAIGTVAGQMVGGFIPLFYFLRRNDSLLRLRRGKFHVRAIGKMVANGASEFVNNISASVVSMALNYFLMAYFGEDGVGAYGIICYVWLIFAAFFIGYNVAVAPRISYALGAGNKKELRNLFRYSMIILGAAGLIQFAFAEALAIPLSHAFAGYDPDLLALTTHAFFIYSMIYLFLGINMFGSAFFTALNNGVVSMVLSFVRLGIFELSSVCLLHLAFGGEALFYAVPFANFLGLIMNLIVFACFSRRYGYSKKAQQASAIEEKAQ